MLYGCEIWGEDGLRGRPGRALTSLQWTILLGICGAYSTVSHEAVRVVTGILPIDLTLKVRKRKGGHKINVMGKPRRHTIGEKKC